MRVRKNVLLTGMITLAAVSILLAGCTDMRDAKPVIYLYPEQTQEVSVQLELDGKLTCAYPELWQRMEGKSLSGRDASGSGYREKI